MTTAPKSARRWALWPVDSCSHLLAEAGSAPIGMLVADCGQLLPCSVDTSPHPPTGLRCPACARATDLKQALRDRARVSADGEITAQTKVSRLAELWLRDIDESDRAIRTKNHLPGRVGSMPRRIDR